LRLYRGVSKGHRHYEDAIFGRSICPDFTISDIKGDFNYFIENHQASIKPSPFVSWSLKKEIAARFAKDDGIILILDIEFDSPSVIIPSNDLYEEFEVLTKDCVTLTVPPIQLQL